LSDATRPAPFSELAPGITLFPARTPTLPPATHTNSYALGQRDLLLVEPATPYDDERREWLAWARALTSGGRTPIGLLCTHDHIDHVGGAEFLSRELELPIWAHAETAERLPGVSVARHLNDGEKILLDGPEPQCWRVLHTPGHAHGHVCLLEEQTRELIVGDMVASVGTILIAPGDGDMRIYIEQLRRLAALAARRALPAHGGPIDDPSALFARYVAHRLMREQKVLDALAVSGDRGARAEELVPGAYDDTPHALFPLALLSLRAHLVKLVDEGRVRRDGERHFPSVQ
jgi:endoribonuclease LACTB2